MSLKDALLKAGLTATKGQNDRDFKPEKVKTKTEKHQEHRNFCDVCELIHPDVERFKHKNPTIDAEWICLNCADKEEIDDRFRVTNQSEFAKTKRYRRFFGATKDFTSTEDKYSGKKRSGGGSRHKKPHHKKRRDFNGNKANGNEQPYDLDEFGEKNFNR
jgi:hypothetical protein